MTLYAFVINVYAEYDHTEKREHKNSNMNTQR